MNVAMPCRCAVKPTVVCLPAAERGGTVRATHRGRVRHHYANDACQHGLYLMQTFAAEREGAVRAPHRGQCGDGVLAGRLREQPEVG